MLFLVDGKLALLQPSSDENGGRKYDMRILAQSVEYYVQMRDQPTVGPSILDHDDHDHDAKADDNVHAPGYTPHTTLRDSLWTFDGSGIRVWTDLQDVIRSQHHLADTPHAVASSTQISVDFYPASILLNKGIILGAESELIQRRDLSFAFFRVSTRVRDDRHQHDGFRIRSSVVTDQVVDSIISSTHLPTLSLQLRFPSSPSPCSPIREATLLSSCARGPLA